MWGLGAQSSMTRVGVVKDDAFLREVLALKSSKMGSGSLFPCHLRSQSFPRPFQSIGEEVRLQ